MALLATAERQTGLQVPPKLQAKDQITVKSTVKLDAVPQRDGFCVPILASFTCSTVLGFYCTGFHSIPKFA